MKKHGKLHQEYLDKRSTVRPIKANNKNLDDILRDEVQHFGYNADLNHIEVSEVTNMRRLFSNSQFNGDISNWDVSNVTDMSNMFQNSQFNGDIANWDVSNAKEMYYMFHKSKFDGDISKWNITNSKRRSLRGSS